MSQEDVIQLLHCRQPGMQDPFDIQTGFHLMHDFPKPPFVKPSRGQADTK